MNQDFIYLASASPRRRELLDQIGIRYHTHPVHIDESRLENEAPPDYVRRVALDKARTAWWAVAGKGPRPVLAADTAVVLDGEVFSQPRDRAHALAMLEHLSGRTHEVLTAVAVKLGAQEESVLSTSRVSFRELGAAEREAYWRSGEPLGKAGAYAIQGRAAVFISALQGSYSGVMGLPLFETARLLEAVGYATCVAQLR
ncbi:MAG: septum formation inhibitor Maf [Gammaproteobacteria bacterium]|nr:septum formation inhibitor Maf [Gammaproteobacteria bacterium]